MPILRARRNPPKGASFNAERPAWSRRRSAGSRCGRLGVERARVRRPHAALKDAPMPERFEIAFLGTGSPLPNADRCGAGQVVVAGDTNVLVDCGWGAARRLIPTGF